MLVFPFVIDAQSTDDHGDDTGNQPELPEYFPVHESFLCVSSPPAMRQADFRPVRLHSGK
jgi:hypothetical protein